MKRYIFLIFTIFTLLFTGCNNLFENNSIESEKTSASDGQDTSSRIVTISGSINAGGAYPAEIAAALESRQAESVSRTAYPSLPATDLTIDVNAETTSSPLVSYSADVNWTAKTYTVGIPLPASGAKNYKITATIKWNNSQILYGESEAFDISLDSPLASKNLTVTPAQTQTGNGTIKLEIESESGSAIAKCKTSLSGDTVFTFSNNKTLIDIGSVSSGNQVIKIDLLDSSDKLLYSFHESVNMFDNLQTNTWIKFGTEPWLVTSGSGSSLTTKCIITNAMVEGFKLTEIYVDPDATETTQSGTFINPCKTLSAAISKLNHADKDYKIYIKGSLTGPQEIPDTLTDTSEGDYHAKSVTIIGYNGLDGNGIPKDSLNGGFTGPTSNGVTLKITSSVPVIIKNLMITGGNNDGDGGGINSTGKLTLDSGAYVFENYTRKCGGGVMNNGGELTIKSGAVIANNTAYNTASDTNYTYGGGGVYNYNGKLVMSGGQIKANTTNQCGGGIYNHMDNKDKITELYIYGDAVIGGDTDADGNKANTTQDSYGGGGIYNRGGLVYFGCTAYSRTGEANTYDYYEPDASKLVEWTGKISHNTSGAWGGGYLNASTSASTSGWSTAEQIKATGITHMMSGQISANKAVKGGGLAVHNGSLCPIHGGIIGGSSSADGNAASQMGGGIFTMTKLNVYDATISNNTASEGGGIYNYDLGLLIFGGTINNNSATSHGGGIYNAYRLQLRENAYIPAGTGGANDVFFEVADDPDADYAPYIMITCPLNPPSDSDGIVATITPSLYANGKTILTYSTSATTTLPAEYGKFAITPENVGGGAVKEWVLSSEGILIEPI